MAVLRQHQTGVCQHCMVVAWDTWIGMMVPGRNTTPPCLEILRQREIWKFWPSARKKEGIHFGIKFNKMPEKWPEIFVVLRNSAILHRFCLFISVIKKCKIHVSQSPRLSVFGLRPNLVLRAFFLVLVEE